ncbi:MAG: hypothetical protein NUV82_04325, partial [Candidatus Komeilibacteria bacterium]|nr:hypothetical protein [Candidatus Komeilibacteria bacterium]
MENKLKQLNNAPWKKVSEILPGAKIAIPDIESEGGFSWDEVVSIKPVGREEVWDIEVEGVHNFMGNDIFAHNTYANGGPALPAHVVAYDSEGNLKKAEPNDLPAGIMTGFSENGSVSFAFNSKALVKVTDENGPVRAGDRLTVSKTQPGFAMKMTEAGQSLGIALKDFDNTALVSEVLAFSNPQYWSPLPAAEVAGGSNSGDLSQTASSSTLVTVSSSGSPTDVLSTLFNAVLTRVQNLWASGDIIKEGMSKTFFAISNLQLSISNVGDSISTMISNWGTRSISISN